MFLVPVSRCLCRKYGVTIGFIWFGGACEGLPYYLVCWTRSPARSLVLVFPKTGLRVSLKPTGFYTYMNEVSWYILLHSIAVYLSLVFLASYCRYS